MRRLPLGFSLLILLLLVAFPGQAFYEMNEVSQLYSSWDVARDVIMQEEYAFVASGEGGLSVVSLSDMQWMHTVATLELSGSVNGLALNGHRLYVAQGNSGLAIVNVADPLNPTLIVERNLTVNALSVTVSNGIAFVGYEHEDSGGIVTADVSAPSSINVLAWMALDAPAQALAYSSPTLYAAAGDQLAVIGVSNPSSPVLYDTVSNYWDANDVAIRGDYAYVTDSAGWLSIVNVADHNNAFQVGTMTTLVGLSSVIIRVEGNDVLAYVADMYALRILDISSPTDPTELSNIALTADSENPRCITVYEDYALVGNGAHGLSAFDVSDDEEPEFLATYKGMRSIHQVAVYGDVAYVIDAEDGFRVVDISTAAEPVEIAAMPFQFNRLVIDGSTAFGTANGAVTLLDLSDPYEPETISTFTFGGNARDILIRGDRAYVAAGVTGLLVLDISDPSTPIQVGALQLGGAIVDNVAWANNRLVASSRQSGVFLVDTANDDLQLLDEYTDITMPRDIEGYMSWVFVAWGADGGGSGGLRILGVTFQGNLAPLGVVDTGRKSVGISLHVGGSITDNYALLAQEDGGLSAIDVNDLMAPFEDGHVFTPGDALALENVGDMIYVADRQHLSIFEGGGSQNSVEPGAETPLAWSLAPVYPNPFNGQASVSLHLPQAGVVDISLFNTLGQRVRTVAHRPFSAGNHVVSLDADGLASGTYLLRASSASGWQQARRLTLVR